MFKSFLLSILSMFRRRTSLALPTVETVTPMVEPPLPKVKLVFDPLNPQPGLAMEGPHGGPRYVVDRIRQDEPYPYHDLVAYKGKDGDRVRTTPLLKWQKWATNAMVIDHD